MDRRSGTQPASRVTVENSPARRSGGAVRVKPGAATEETGEPLGGFTGDGAPRASGQSLNMSSLPTASSSHGFVNQSSRDRDFGATIDQSVVAAARHVTVATVGRAGSENRASLSARNRR